MNQYVKECKDLQQIIDGLLAKAASEKKEVEEEFSPKKKSAEINISNFLNYFCTQLEFLSMAAQDKNASTENKCQSFYTLEEIRQFLALSSKCYIVRRFIFQFFYHVYLDTEKEYQNIEGIVSILSILIQDLADIVASLEGIKRLKIYVKSFKGAPKYKTMIEEYLYQTLLESIDIALTKNIYYGRHETKQVFTHLLEVIARLTKVSTKPQQIIYLSKMVFKIENKKHIKLLFPNFDQCISQMSEKVQAQIKRYQANSSKFDATDMKYKQQMLKHKSDKNLMSTHKLKTKQNISQMYQKQIREVIESDKFEVRKKPGGPIPPAAQNSCPARPSLLGFIHACGLHSLPGGFIHCLRACCSVSGQPTRATK